MSFTKTKLVVGLGETVQGFSQGVPSNGAAGHFEMVLQFPPWIASPLWTLPFLLLTKTSGNGQLRPGRHYLCGSNAPSRITTVQRVVTLRFQLALIKKHVDTCFSKSWGVVSVNVPTSQESTVGGNNSHTSQNVHVMCLLGGEMVGGGVWAEP